jgi:hypothetical protein
LIGLFPYGLAYPFAGRGVFTILAYPRLWLLLTMFAVAVVSVAWTRKPVLGDGQIHATTVQTSL